ncbi:LacI family DNA-binding transcriptional regulator [Anaerobacillus isosaccharinicus]|uniref:LacI family DNA-binding transcriptional regulator n=1 Tax=Anaerobacillus isosaccharinicus TaxID=1532552 RepID=A0A1S2LI22_9BACI|nr:LacI family DNA-binding transcriptional regulator [Anaerobacillus isosaccharinicus]MBA5584726.1 LacI family DNA-binding transcriptional regulator [Anaerobacillus isosaccharinicus]QOY36905.1 LacI family DNA-binding transcriptional regulator [Anaerobacillus isosaccharinicus]
MKATMKDVATLANVSMSTVSRVLNNPETVVPEKRERVLAAIKTLKYHPNALARGLIYKRTRTYGVLIPDVSNMYSAEVLKGMEEAANVRGMNLIICNTDLNKDRKHAYINVLNEKQVDGILYMSEAVFPDDYKVMERLAIPFVLASTHCLEYPLPSVKVDDEQGGYDATLFLVSKGHKEIGMISGPTTDIIAGQSRLQGYMRCLRDHHLPVNVDKNVQFGHYRFQDGFEAMERLYQSNNITAVFCASDEMALGAISYLHSIKVDVPNDLSVIGYDNTKVASMSIPPLTTVAQPMYEIGYKAVEKLEDLINGNELKQLRTYLPHQIIERKSVKEI